MEQSKRETTREKGRRAIDASLTLAEESLRAQRSIGVSEMAEACFLSESHFRRLFASVMGESPKAYLMRKRMELAAELLRDGEQTVTEISFRCGFHNHSTFYREFVKHYGCNPTEYRERNGE
ncbi:MAG: helix-turn-helix transcriptional regulator [Clostridia bacterium]|nr:helix-turn-helix transcriptional regulator [Clostridia bacterium]